MTFSQWHIEQCKKMPSDKLNKMIQDLRTDPGKVKRWIVSNLDEWGMRYIVESNEIFGVYNSEQQADQLVEEMKKEWIKKPAKP